MKFFSALLGAPWKLATIGAGIVAATLGFLLFMSNMEKASLNEQKAELTDRIENPRTGYVARLAQANANVVELRTSIERQNTVIRQREGEARQAQAELERLRGELRTAQANSAELRQRLQRFMATRPQGDSLTERVNDIDRRVLEDLKQ